MIVPPSKSITHRALFCAGLASSPSTIINPLICDDTHITQKVLAAMQRGSRDFFCGESGTTWRFITALTSALQIPAAITGEPSLLRRPIKPLLEALKNLGSTISLEGNISSQFLSALLLAAPLTKTPTVINLATPLVSKPYVDLTIAVQKEFGVVCHCEERSDEAIQFSISPQQYRPAAFEVEGDWSSAAVWIAAGLLWKDVALEGLNPNSLQGDRRILDIVKEMGGELFWEDEKLVVKKSKLRGVKWDLSQTPDLFPIVSVLAHCAEGKSEWSGVERLKFKESNRLLEIADPTRSKDHRIVMAGAILGLATGKKMVFQYPDCVAKSYPDFWNTFYPLSRAGRGSG